MSERRPDEGETRVWRAEAVGSALGERRRASRRDRSARGGGSRRSQLGWRVVLWAIALALGWYAGIRYFG